MPRPAAEPTPESPADAADPCFDVFRHIVSEKSALYRRAIGALVAAKARYRLQLRVDEVARAMRDADPGAVAAADDELASALDQLAAWGNLRRSQDVREVATLAEFHHRRSLYQLTPAGEAAHRGIVAVEECLGASGGRLSSVMLPAIADRLEALGAEAAAPAPDAAKLYALFNELHGYSSDLAENARRFMNDLSDALDALTLSDAGFLEYKRAVLAYLQGFVAVLDRHHGRIVAALGAVEHAGLGRTLETAASADLAPDRDGVLRGPVAELTARWDALRAWFAGRGREPAEAEHLRGAMLDAIGRILLVLDRLNEQRFRRVNRSADFVRLAQWFAGAADDDAAHRLFVRAFGLHSARHFRLAVEDDETGRGRSWQEAPPVVVAPRLREAGRRTVPGRPGRVADYGAAKRASLAGIRMRQARMERAAQRFLAGPVRLSDLSALGHEEFRFLLDLLDAALRAVPGGDGTRRGATHGGQYRVLWTQSVPAATVEIHCPDGRLVAAIDATLTVVAAVPARAAGARAGAAPAAAAARDAGPRSPLAVESAIESAAPRAERVAS